MGVEWEFGREESLTTASSWKKVQHAAHFSLPAATTFMGGVRLILLLPGHLLLY